MIDKYNIRPGKPKPLGATCYKNGVNFSVFSENATEIELLIFKHYDDINPFLTVKMDKKKNSTFHSWHVFVEGLKPGLFYAYRADGPFDLKKGHRFNKKKVLIDPYSRGITSALWNKAEACSQDDNLKYSMRSVIIDDANYDWGDDRPLKKPMQDTIIYELHVGGFTKSPTSKCRYPGKFKGLVEKIPYLKSLGITAVELLPIFDFDDSPYQGPGGTMLKNYWGYGTIGYFAPEGQYCLSPVEGTHLKDFRDMVKAFHKAGIEVILDVVFGYTPEGNEHGPVLSFKGLDNSVYYQLSGKDMQYYMDLSGCGNTLNCNHPIVAKFVLDCLEFWVKEMHVDGFRFDEGSILSRDENGNPMKYPTVLWNIELSNVLADTKIIAEAWDAAGFYQVGCFPGYRYAEWNGRFRDDIRRFVKGDGGLIGAVASRMGGSADLYQPSDRLPTNSVNFVTCHDGFTLNDLVSYDQKHNEKNGENNNDGINENNSWNCGIEGETDDARIERLRIRQIKNMALILMLSRGVPMILAGDEVRRTQKGSNNAYCQDNEISWFDWTLVSKNKEILNFYKKIIQFRKEHPVFSKNSFYNTDVPNGKQEISYHGCVINGPGWNDVFSKVLAFTVEESEGRNNKYIHVMMNMEMNDTYFQIPYIPKKKWKKVIDTSEFSTKDIVNIEKAFSVGESSILVKSHSVVVLISK